MEPYEIHFELTADESRRATRRFWWRQAGSTFVGVASVLTATACLSSLVRPWHESLAMALWTAATFCWLQIPLGYRAYQNARAAVRRLGRDRSVTMRFSAARIEQESTNVAVSMAWRLVVAVWRHDDMWLLLFAGGGFWAMPTTSLDPELRQFILDQMKRTRQVRKRMPRCLRCGYDLRGQTTPRCPECGLEFDPEHLETRH